MRPLTVSVAESITSAHTDVVVADARTVAARLPGPKVTTINVTNSSKVHIGPKIVSITQNATNTEKIKGRCVGLEFVSSKRSGRVRCGVAVFICWAIIVVIALIAYLVYVALPKQTRLDIELPLPKYVWSAVKNSSRTERLSCALALVVLITCITLIVYFTMRSRQIADSEDSAPHEWNITSEMWLAQPYNDSDIEEQFLPIMLVVVQHTVSGECTKFAQCAGELRTMQGWFISHEGYNIPYNFIIGNDARVYEGRGWNKEGAHTLRYNKCTLGLGFVGDYREEREHHTQVTELQMNRTRMLLDYGVSMGYLRADYLIAGANDVTDTQSPGSNLYNALQTWSNFDHERRFKNMSCEQILKTYGNVTFNEE